MSLTFDPSCLETRRNPYPKLAALRRGDPVHWSDALQAWIVTRYVDVVAMTRDAALSAERLTPFFARLSDPERGRIAAVIANLSAWMVFRDPPVHGRLRMLAARAFTPGRIRHLKPRIEALFDGLLSEVDAKAFELVGDLAGPLPALVIMDLLGVPRADMPAIKHWSDELALFVGSAQATPDKYARAEAGAKALADYFRPLLVQRRVAPGGDLLSDMLKVAKGNGSSDDEVVATAVLLLFAGHETTTHLITNAVYHMVTAREPWQQLADDTSLAKGAVEEILRYDGPVMSMPRVVAEPFVLHGKQLLVDQRVFAMVNSANRDEKKFSQPDKFDLTRRGSRHIGFGHGIHTCLGAPLARLEGAVVLGALAKRLPDLDIAEDEPCWLDSMVFRGLRSLDVRS
ncbi:MAG: cytochrome P450 [Chromatiales bacterium]|jgi:cytochrome P450|nr:cytochrome P450 [Chromatiales bacterium]